MENQRKTFLSYSRANKDFAIRLARELKAEGFQIWLDQLDIPAGARWDREVERALRDSEIFMIILTPASVDSENVLDEIGYAIDSKKRFLPVLLENCEIPLRLRRFQYVDFTNKSFDDGVESAKELLRSLSAQSTIPQGPLLGTQVQTDVERKAKEETDRLAALKAEEERLTIEKADLERRVKEEAERLYTQKAEEERQAKAKADAERKAKAEARRKAKAEADHLATQKVEEERGAKQKIEEELAVKTKAERAAKVKAIPAATKVTPITAASTQKKPIFNGFVISILVIAMVVTVGFGIKAILNRGKDPTPTPFATVARNLINYENGTFNPELIENWNSNDKVWTFYISQDVILQNGDPLTSGIVEQYLSSKDLVRSGKAKVEIVDDFTFKVTLSQTQESQNLFRALSDQGFICRK